MIVKCTVCGKDIYTDSARNRNYCGRKCMKQFFKRMKIKHDRAVELGIKVSPEQLKILEEFRDSDFF